VNIVVVGCVARAGVWFFPFGRDLRIQFFSPLLSFMRLKGFAESFSFMDVGFSQARIVSLLGDGPSIHIVIACFAGPPLIRRRVCSGSARFFSRPVAMSEMVRFTI